MERHYEFFRAGPTGGTDGDLFEAAIPPDGDLIALIGADGETFLSHIGLIYLPGEPGAPPPNRRIEMGRSDHSHSYDIDGRRIIAVAGKYHQTGSQTGITMLAFQFESGDPVRFGSEDADGAPFSFTFPANMELAGFYGRHDDQQGVIYAFGVVVRRLSQDENPFLGKDKRWKLKSSSCGDVENVYLQLFNTMKGTYAMVVVDEDGVPQPRTGCKEIELVNPLDEQSMLQTFHQEFHFNAVENVLNNLTNDRQISYWRRPEDKLDGIQGVWQGAHQAPPWCRNAVEEEEEDGSWGAEEGG